MAVMRGAMNKKPRCKFLNTGYPFDQTYPEPLLGRLNSIVEIVRPEGDTDPPDLDGVQICVGWDDSPVVEHLPGAVELVVHCGVAPQAVFRSISVPAPWEGRPGPRAWDHAGLRPAGGGHWIPATDRDTISGTGLRVVAVSEPVERTIAEKLLAVTIMAICDANFGWPAKRDGSASSRKMAELERDFYDVCLGIVGCGGAAAAFARLLRNFEIGLLVHEPDFSPQQVHELGAEFCDDLRTVARKADVVILFPYKNAGRAIPGTELWSALPEASRIIVVNGGLVIEGSLSGFKGRAYVGCSEGEAVQYADSPNVHPIAGLDRVNLNALSRVGREVVDVIHRYVAQRDAQRLRLP